MDDKKEKTMEDAGFITLQIAYFPGLHKNPVLKVGLHTPKGITTINEFRGDNAIGLLNTLTNPKIQKIIPIARKKGKTIGGKIK